MIRNLVVALAGLVSGLIGCEYARLWLIIVLSSSVVALVYFLVLPYELPYWPAVVVVGASAIIGWAWDRRSSELLGVSSNLSMNQDAKKSVRYRSVRAHMAAASQLKDRWNSELKYWRLRWWQLGLLLLWSAWPWLCSWLLPGHEELWLFPQFPFLAIGYLVGGLFMAILPGVRWAYPFGVSFTVFCITYLIMVSWRWHRDGKPKA